MVKLHLVGFSSDLKSLVFSTRKGAKSGTYTVDVNARLKRTLEEIESRQADIEAEEVAPPQREAPRERRPLPPPERSAVPPSKLSPKEIQALLREGKTPEEVARIAECDVSWIERFTSPILAERAVVVDIVRAAKITRQRRGLSAVPVEEAILLNLADKNVRLTPEQFDEGWSAVRREGQWEVTFTYRSRGRGMDAEFVVDHERTVRAANAHAGTIGWRPLPGQEDDEAPEPVPARATPEPATAEERGETATGGAEAPAEPASRRRTKGWDLPARRDGAVTEERVAAPAAAAPRRHRQPRAAAQEPEPKPEPEADPAAARPRRRSAKPAPVASGGDGPPARPAPAPTRAPGRTRSAKAAASPPPPTPPAARSTRSSRSSGSSGSSGRAPGRTSAGGSGRSAGGTTRARAGGGAAAPTGRRTAASAVSPPKRGTEATASIPVPPAPARRRTEPTGPKLRPGQPVSLADVGWAIPLSGSKRKSSASQRPSGRSS